MAGMTASIHLHDNEPFHARSMQLEDGRIVLTLRSDMNNVDLFLRNLADVKTIRDAADKCIRENTVLEAAAR